MTKIPLEGKSASGATPFVQTTSVRRGLPLIIGVGLLVPFVLISMAVYTYIYRTEQLSWQDRQAEASAYASSTVGHYVSDAIVPLHTLGLLDRSYLEQSPALVNDLLLQENALLELLRVDQQGQVFAAADRDTATLADQLTIRQSVWFARALAGETYISEVQLTTDNALYLIVSVPAPDGGVVAGRLSMNVLWETIDTIRFGQTGTAYVIDTHGDIIAHTDRAVAMQDRNVFEQSGLEQLRANPEIAWSGIYTNIAGQRVLASTSPVEGTNWLIVTEVQESEAFGVSRSAALLLIGIMAGFYAVILYVMTRQLGRFIFDPLQTLTEGAARVGRGDLNHTIPIVRRDEIGSLTNAFNRMTDRLRERDQQLAEESLQRENLIAELQVATEAAAESSRLKSEFLSTMSHELRTPLNAIIGFSGILLEGMAGQLDPVTRPMVDSIYNSSKHLLELINNILDVSKIEAGRVQFVYAATPLQDMVDEWTKQIDVLAARKSLTLTTTVEPHVPEVLKLDKARVTQIALNLLGNAVKFTDAGSIMLHVNWIDGYIVLKVADTGIGIPSHALGFIFDEFRQVNSTSSRKYEGTGLGLAVVRKLCSAMNGSVQVKSSVGDGSEFIVTLPAPQVSEAELVS